MSTDEENREQGVEFGSLGDELERVEYPISSEDLLERYGEREITLQDGDETLREVLEPLGEDTYESADDVIQSVIGMVDDEAVGRKGYTDRGGMVPEENESDESM